MHNEEGKLFSAVFYRLLALGVVVISVAAVVWMVWAIVRASAITGEAAERSSADESSMHRAPVGLNMAPLANVRDYTADVPELRGEAARPDGMIALVLRPVAHGLARLDRRFDRLPDLVSDAAFFAGGPS